MRKAQRAGRARLQPWQPALSDPGGAPIYLAVVDAMAADIASGRLQAGDRLPTQRALADALGIDITTVTRAYGEAQRRGLTEATVGRGTFVRGGEAARRAAAGRIAAIDTSMNLPPQPPDALLPERVAEGFARLQRRADFAALTTYHLSGGSAEDREAGALWLKPRLPAATADRVLVTAGAQAALVALLTTYAKAGDVILADRLTYPGFRALAAHLGLTVAGLAADDEGILPDALDQACRRLAPKALYCVPTIANPTTATMSAERRAAIAAIARRRGLMVIADDAYAALPAAPPEPLAALLPDRTFQVASLAKCLTPGLRVGYLLAPDATHAARLAQALRATQMMAAPLMTALAGDWIRDGSARAIAAAVRRESAARQRLARDLLPAGATAAHPEGHHLWLTLPQTWNRTEFAARLRPRGLAVVPSDAFAVDPAGAPNAVRIALGAAPDREQLRLALEAAAAALATAPALWSEVV